MRATAALAALPGMRARTPGILFFAIVAFAFLFFDRMRIKDVCPASKKWRTGTASTSDSGIRVGETSVPCVTIFPASGMWCP